MNKVLVLGGGGMLGHMAVAYFSSSGFETHYTTRKGDAVLGLPNAHALDTPSAESLRTLFESVSPNLIVNAIGAIKQKKFEPAQMAFLNGVLPHLIAANTPAGVKFVHVSTDCVFSGNKGDYTDKDIPDPVDFYGRSKLCGEVDYQPHCTMRTSIIGPELGGTAYGLLEWFNHAPGPVNGFRNHHWSGLTTLQAAKHIRWIFENNVSGLVVASGPKINKFDLLQEIKTAFGHDIVVNAANGPTAVDRSLVQSAALALKTPAHGAMLAEMASFVAGGYKGA